MKTRVFPEHNYKGIHINGKTIRIALDPKKPIEELKWPEFYDVKVTPYCEGNCSYCVHPDTLIETSEGQFRIKDVNIDDKSIEEKMKILRKYREIQYIKLQEAVYRKRGWNAFGCPTIEIVKVLGIDYDDVIHVIKPYQ